MNQPWPVPTLCCICNTKLVVRFMGPNARLQGGGGIRAGSWSQCTAERPAGLSMNLSLTESEQPFESGAEDARTPNAVARTADSASAKRLECVRFIGAFRPAP